MPTQPTGVWNISKIEAIETAAGAELPSTVIPPSTSFDLQLTFEGKGAAWNALVSAKAAYEVKFYAESYGPGVEQEIASYKGTLAAGENKAKATVTGGLNAGIYHIVGLVRVSPGSGMTGFLGDLVVEVGD
jgi:hypothetical protein